VGVVAIGLVTVCDLGVGGILGVVRVLHELDVLLAKLSSQVTNVLVAPGSGASSEPEIRR
jgi:hypothetical protein